ncbi:MAG: TerC family protein [Planctomycetota bacterium]
MDWITDPNAWIALATLTALEIVLGIDNIVFISILSGRLPEEQRAKARTLGLAVALIGRVVLLLSINWVMGLTEDLFEAFGKGISGRDLILLLGGLFLLGKATHEIHANLEGDSEERAGPDAASFASVLFQILLLDVVFSLDSVITAVGMADQIGVMITAVVISIGFMMVSARSVSGFIHRHPTVKMLALSFLLLVGMALMAEGWDLHIPRGYIYFAMGFSIFVEMLNLKVKSKRKKPVELREPHFGDG